MAHRKSETLRPHQDGKGNLIRDFVLLHACGSRWKLDIVEVNDVVDGLWWSLGEPPCNQHMRHNAAQSEDCLFSAW